MAIQFAPMGKRIGLSDLILRNPALSPAASANENWLTRQRIVFVNSLRMVNRR
jgi:hypothetical protein